MIKNYDESIKINYNPNWLFVPEYFYRILIIGGKLSNQQHNK